MLGELSAAVDVSLKLIEFPKLWLLQNCGFECVMCIKLFQVAMMIFATASDKKMVELSPIASGTTYSLFNLLYAVRLTYLI